MLARILAVVCLCVCHKWVFYQNGCTDRAGFWNGGFFRPIPPCVLAKFGYRQKQGYFLVELCPKLGTLSRWTKRVISSARRRWAMRPLVLTCLVLLSCRGSADPINGARGIMFSGCPSVCMRVRQHFRPPNRRLLVQPIYKFKVAR